MRINFNGNVPHSAIAKMGATMLHQKILRHFWKVARHAQKIFFVELLECAVAIVRTVVKSDYSANDLQQARYEAVTWGNCSLLSLQKQTPNNLFTH